MKRLIVCGAFCLLSFLSFSQMLTPVTWDFSVEKNGQNEFTLLFTADVNPGWVIYSQYLESDDGPIPTQFTYEQSAGIQLIGANEEVGHLKTEYDDLFQMNLKKLSGKVIFKQKVKGKSGTKLNGYLTYMTCDSERCLPPVDVDFDLTLP